jgi:hypothetical protein
MRRLLVGFASVVVATCGNSPTQPSSTPTIVSVTLTVPAFVMIGAPVQAGAAALMSDGTMATTGFTFSVDAAPVATVNATGLVTGVAAGSVTLTAGLRGKSASQTLRVVPDVHGTWTGTYTMDTCTATGSLSCGAQSSLGAFFVPGVQPMTLTISQREDAIIAFVDGLQFILTINGTLAVDGSMSLSGMTSPPPGLPTVGQLSIQGWRSVVMSGALVGRFTFVVAVSGTDSLTITCSIVSLGRSGFSHGG